MIAIVDYGVGNLFSLKSSFSMIGQAAAVTGDPAVLREAERLILPIKKFGHKNSFQEYIRNIKEVKIFGKNFK